jgi:hypothetical protein
MKTFLCECWNGSPEGWPKRHATSPPRVVPWQGA